MGSPLGPVLANFYMCNLENEAMSKLNDKPSVYCRYVDDCFLVINNIRQLETLKDFYQENSVLKFTYETEVKKKLPFPDVLIDKETNLKTTVYIKSSSRAETINYNSLCPLKYKKKLSSKHCCTEHTQFAQTGYICMKKLRE